MKFVKSIKNSPKALANAIKYYFYLAPRRFFYAKYYALYELVAYRLLATTTVMVRQLIIRQGKNPDYVAPPLPPPPAPTMSDAVGEIPVKSRPQINVPFVPSWVRASFKTIAAHPIYKSRIGLNLQPNRTPVPSVPEPIQVVKAPEPTPEPVCDQCLHPDHDGLHTCDKLKLTVPEVALTTPDPTPYEGDISVNDSGELTFTKFGDSDES